MGVCPSLDCWASPGRKSTQFSYPVAKIRQCSLGHLGEGQSVSQPSAARESGPEENLSSTEISQVSPVGRFRSLSDCVCRPLLHTKHTHLHDSFLSSFEHIALIWHVGAIIL